MVAVSLTGMRAEDVQSLAHLHRTAFPGYFLSELGEPFLVQLYRGYLVDETAVSVVARAADGAAVGSVIGTTEPAGFFRRLLRRRWLGFAAASARAVLADPRKARRLMRALTYRGDAPAGTAGALLSSICVDTAEQGGGVGGQMLEAWTEELRRRGVPAAFLTTDAENNDAVNRFYHDRGWSLTEHYLTPEGRAMNRYTISLVQR